MKTIIFGIGNYYQKRKKELATYKQIEIVAFSDNNDTFWGKKVDGFQVISPDLIKDFPYDKILIMSTYGDEIFSQLIQLGIERSKILFWELFRSEILQGKREIFLRKGAGQAASKKILIISDHLDYHGGAIVSVYAAVAIQNRGYEVVLVVPGGSKKFIEETVDRGVTVVICPALPYIYEKEKEWIRQFDLVIVTLFPMIQSAYASCLLRPTLWWIHETSEVYSVILSKAWNNIAKDRLNHMNVYAVSNLAKNNFNALFADRIRKTMCYGIPDLASGELTIKEGQSKVTFAIIGNICERKAQDIFVEAVSRLECKEQAEFWIIGHCPDNILGRRIQVAASNIPSIKLLGVLTREEIYSVFTQIDVVVCASREETMSIAINEGMMFGKACITTEKTGVAEYIRDGENGFVVPAEDVDALRDRMEWMISHRDESEYIGKAARETYEQYFTMEAFGERLEKALTETEMQWRDS